MNIQDAFVDGRIDVAELERGLEREAAPGNEVTVLCERPHPMFARGFVRHGDTHLDFELEGSPELVTAAIEALKCVVAKEAT